MSFLPPVILEIRAQAAQFYAETAKVAEAVKTMATETDASAAGMADKVGASATQMGSRVATAAEMMAAKSAAEAEAMARQVVAEADLMDAGATKAAEDMARKIAAAFEAMEAKTTASMQAQTARSAAALEAQNARAAASEEIMANKIAESAAKVELAEARAAKAATDTAAETTAAGIKMQESFTKTALTAVSSMGSVTGALAGAAAKQAEAAAGSSANLMGIANGITKVAAVTGLVVAGIGLDMAAHFQKSTTLLVTAGGESKSQLENVRAGILDIATATGTSAEQLSEGMYVMEKAGYRGASGLAALRASAEGAKAENVDLATMTQATTDILLDYGYKMGTAKDATASSVSVVNQLVAASGAAKTTMQDYAASMAAVVPIASSAKISFAEVGGAIATMTQHGQTAQQSSQNLANLIQALIRPNQQASAAMQQMGIDTVGLAQHLGDAGLSGTLKKVHDTILDHMGSDGLVVQSTMKDSASATSALKEMMAQMPPELARLSQSLLDGTTTQKDYGKAVKDMGGTAGAVGDQFASLYKRSQGVNDSLKAGQPAMMTYQAEMTKVLGNVTAARAATMLLMNNSDDLNRSIQAVSDAAGQGGDHIATWAETQQTLSVQLDMAKQRSENLAIAIGTKLIPVANGALSGFQDLFNGFEQGNPVLLGIAGLLGGAMVVSLTAYTIKMIEAGVATVDKMVTMGAEAIAMGGKFVAGFMTSEVAVGQFATKAELAGAKVRGMAPALGALGVVAAGAGIAVLGLSAAQKEWGTNDTAPKLDQVQKALAALASSADKTSKTQMDNLFKQFDDGALKRAPQNVNDLDSAIKALTHKSGADNLNLFIDSMSRAFGGETVTGIGQVEDRIKGIGDGLGQMVQGGQLDSAATSFNKLATSYEQNGKSAQDALDAMPAYKKSLQDLAAQTGQTLAPQELLDLAMGKIPDSMKQGANAVKTYTDATGQARPMSDQMAKALDDVGVAADGQITKLGNLYDAMVKTGLANLSARDAEFHFGDAVQKAGQKADELKAKLEGNLSTALNQNATDFNKSTAAGQEAESAFSSVAQAGLQTAGIMAHDVTKGAGDVTNSLHGTYDAMIKTAEKFGLGSTQAEDLTRSVLNIPKGVSIDTWMADTAKKMAEQTKNAVDNIPTNKLVSIEIRTTATGPGASQVDVAMADGSTERVNRGQAGLWTGGSVAEALGMPGAYTGGDVASIMGFAGGGVLPGRPPTNPRIDNMLATVNGRPLKVRSGEFLVNEPQTKRNMPWLKAVNAGLNLSDVFAPRTPTAALTGPSTASVGRPLPGGGSGAPAVTNNTSTTKEVTNNVTIHSTADARSLAAEFSRMTANMS